MKCRAVQKEIEEMEAGQPLSAQTDAHLSACDFCRMFKDERAALRSLIGGLERVSAPPDFDWRLRARLMEERTEREPTRRWFAVFAPGTQALALAATFVFLVAGVVVYRQTMSPGTNKKETAATATTPEKTVAQAANTSTQASSVQDSSAATASYSNTAEPESKETPRKGRAIRSAKTSVARAEPLRSGPAPQRILSNDFGTRPAEELSATGPSLTNSGPVFPVPVRSAKGARLQFEDGLGTKRTLAPVIFGGQESIGRTDAVRLVSTGNKGVW